MDIALLINKFLADKDHLRTEDDSLNIGDNCILSWDFANIPCPTMEELEALAPVVDQELLQAKTNAESLKFLAETDWQITRELETGTLCPAEVKQARAEARAKIIK